MWLIADHLFRHWRNFHFLFNRNCNFFKLLMSLLLGLLLLAFLLVLPATLRLGNLKDLLLVICF